ncbi:MAG: aldo/keto reductase [Anaerohalosphaera sp.]|nr:aldo/keto reductase [Anaerohalosphaera sp.]
MSAKQMQLVDLGKRSGLKVYPVSIGAMRLPEDDEQSTALLRQAIDANMVYIDTCRGYPDSERKVGLALKNGYREKVILSTKWSPWLRKIEEDDDASADCTYKRIIESLERLDVEYVDFYQVWNIYKPAHFEFATRKGGMVEGIIRAMDEGLVKHTGFTTHDTPRNVCRYIDRADWAEVVLFTYNMINPTYKELVEKAHDKGIGTIVMNPMGGGMFTEESPVINNAVKDSTGIESPIEAAHRYLSGDNNVDTIITGIAKPSDITSTIENYEKPTMTADQTAAVEQAMAEISKENMGFCTNCKYCLPCPAKIDIPAMMKVAYLARLLKVPAKAKAEYSWTVNPNNPDCSAAPDQCLQCGACELKCTQRLKVMQQLKYIAENISEPTEK